MFALTHPATKVFPAPTSWTAVLSTLDDNLFFAIADCARAAGDIALGFFNAGAETSAAVEYKAGNSPVTLADRLVDDYLRQHLGALIPSAAWLSEETADSPARLKAAQIFIVDPIDGTRAFMSGDARWAVSVALVRDGLPEMAVLHAPALGDTFSAVRGHGAWRNNAMIATKPEACLRGGRIAGPKSFADQLRHHGLAFELVPKIPSLALRFANVAAGDLDAAFASQNAHEWDIAAADLILHEAGGVLLDIHGQALRYNQPHIAHGMLFAGARPVAAEFAAMAKKMIPASIPR